MRWRFYGFVFAVFSTFAFLVWGTNELLVGLFDTEVRFISPFTEPILTKLAPVASIYYIGTPVVAMVGTVSASLFFGVDFPRVIPATMFVSAIPESLAEREPVSPNPWLLGAFGGSIFGLWELIARGDNFHVQFWQEPAFHVGQFLPFLLHIWEGTIVVGAFLLVDRGKRTLWFLGGALVLAIATHWTFNTWVVSQDWIWDTWRMILT